MNWLFLLSMITASISLLFALVFLAIYRQRRELAATRCWGIAYLLLVVAMASVGLRIVLPSVNPHIFSNALAVTAGLSCAYLYYGIRCWRGMELYSKIFRQSVVALILVLGFTSFLNPGLEPTTLVVSRLYIGVFCALAVHALLVGDKPKNIGHYLAATFLVAIPVTQLASLYIVFFMPSIPDGIAASTIEELSNSRLAAVNFVGLPISFTGIALFCLLGVLLELGKQLLDESLHDWLTGAYNRRGFGDIAERQFLQSKRRGSNLSLVIFDMDNFKTINDEYGHIAGDRALINVAALLRERLRDSDVVARWGGEEFIFLMPDSNQAEAFVKADEIRQYLQRRPLVLDEKTRVTLSASFGVAQRKSGDENMEAIIHRADNALYQSKADGKNRVTLGMGNDRVLAGAIPAN